MTATASANPNPPTRRPRLRFTLRLLLAFITLLCIGLGIWTHRAREQRRLVERIIRSAGTVRYDIQQWGDSTLDRSPIPQWLLNSLGPDYFHQIKEVSVSDAAMLSDLTRLRRLECLKIHDSSLTDLSFVPIARLRSLTMLCVYPGGPAGLTLVGDKSLAAIGELPKLDLVTIAGGPITPDGLAALAKSNSLRTVDIVSSDERIDNTAAEPFRHAGRARRVKIQRWSTDGAGTVLAEAQWNSASD